MHAHNEIRAAALASDLGPPTTLFAVDNGGPRIKAACADIATERHGTERGLHHGTTPAGCEGGVTGGVSGRIDVVPVALGDRNRQQAHQSGAITPVYARGAGQILPGCQTWSTCQPGAGQGRATEEAGAMLGCLLGLGVLAKTLPFHAQLQPEALATSRGASGAKPVHVSEMFEDVCDLGTDWRPLSEMGLKPKAAGVSETGVQEDAMYNAEPVCGLTEEGGSPGEYCKFGIRDFCGTAIDTAHFPSACTEGGTELYGGGEGTELFFDQFALERTMLGKWLAYPDSYGWRVPANDSTSDESQAHGHIVVPSYLFHCLASRKKVGNAKWEHFTDGHQDGYRMYWRKIQEMLDYFRDSRSLVVIHSSFTPDTPAVKGMFETLAEQPPEFVSRVVIASLESNLKAAHKRQLFDAMMRQAQEKAEQRRQRLKADDSLASGVLLDPAVKLPTLPWVDDASRSLQNLKANALKYTPSQFPGPLLVTLPYPTSLQNAVAFSKSSHGYDGQRVRPISVLLFGLSHRRNPSAIPTRNALWHQLQQAGAVVPEGSSEETPSLMLCAEGVDCGAMQWKSLFDQTANSAFCLQPAGDTLTRSHFYLSVLSGCIPVIFESSARGDYEDTQHTAWAFRHVEDLDGPSLDEDAHRPDESPLFLDYSSFTVNVPLSQGGGIAPQPGFLQELMEMQSKDPKRFANLREQLDKVAP